MTVPTGTFQTFQQTGIREDLSDVIYDISPVETPFLSLARRGKTTNRFAEWQTDALAAAVGTNATIEGDDATTDTATATTRLRNFCQLMDKVVRTSSTADAVLTAGRKRELNYQVVKRGRELKRDMETRLTGNFGSSAGTASTPRELGGLESWYVTNTDRAASGAADGGYSATNNTTGAATDTSAGALRTFTETLLKTAVRTAWSAGGSPELIMTGPFNKQVASNFSGIATLYRDTAGSMRPASILAAADIYVSDYGQHRIIPNRFSRDRTVHVLDMDFWEVAYLQPFKIERLAKTGHSERRMLSVEFTLCSKNEAASAVIADLVTSGFTP